MAGARGIRAGKAFVELYANDNKLTRGLRSAQRKLKRFSATVTGMGARLAGLASLTAVPLSFTIKAASDMEETMNKFNVVFGDNSKVVKTWSDKFAADVGRSKQQVADFMAGSQDLFVPLGFEAGAATEMSKEITSLAVDLASFNNMADADVIRDLHAALTGSGEVMKKYGVLVSEAAVKQELLRTGMDPKTATDQQKVMARLSIIMQGTTAAQGDAIRSAGSFANQMKRLKSTISDAAVELGNALLPTITTFVKYTADVISNIAKWAENNQELVKTIAIVSTVVGSIGVALIALGGIAAFAGLAISGFLTVFSVAATVIGAVLSPIGLVITAVVAAAGAFLYFSGVGGAVLSFLQNQFGELLKSSTGVLTAIKNALMSGDFATAGNILWKMLEIAWLTGVNKLNAVLGEWKEYFLSIWHGTIDSAAGYFIDTWADLQTTWSNVTQFFGDAWDQVMNRIQKVWSAVGGRIIDGIDSIMDYMKVIHPAMRDILPESGQFRFQTKQSTGVGMTSAEIDSATNASTAERMRQAEARRRQISDARTGARDSIGSMSQQGQDERRRGVESSQRAAENNLNNARSELANLIASQASTMSDETDETPTSSEAEENARRLGELAKNVPDVSKEIGGGSGNSSQLGRLVSTINAAGAGRTMEQLARDGNSLQAEAVRILDIMRRRMENGGDFAEAG